MANEENDMPRVRFSAAFAFTPKPSVTVLYPAGFEGLVPRAAAEKAIAAGKAEPVQPKQMAPVEEGDAAEVGAEGEGENATGGEA